MRTYYHSYKNDILKFEVMLKINPKTYDQFDFTKIDTPKFISTCKEVPQKKARPVPQFVEITLEKNKFSRNSVKNISRL